MSDGKDQFDRWIEQGVEHYAGAEPPLGMEARVLVALEQAKPRTWWRPWIMAVPVAALLALVVGLSVQKKTRPQPTSPQVSKAAPTAAAPAVVARAPQRQRRPAQPQNIGRDARQDVSRAGIARRPERFPTAAPASEQERLLAQLARNRAAAQTVAARSAARPEEIVISGITIKPIEIPLLPGPNEGE